MRLPNAVQVPPADAGSAPPAGRARPHRRWIELAVVAVLLAAIGVVTAAILSAFDTGGTSRPGALVLTRRPAASRARPTRHPAAAGGSVVARLSLAQLAGQRILYAYSGPRPPGSLLARIRAGEAAGVVFYGPNIPSHARLHAAIAELQRANASSPVRAPLLMLVDQEGGQVRRLPGAPELSEKQIGASPLPLGAASLAGAEAAANLAGVGMNVNLAPVLDVSRSPGGGFIDQFERSYGSDPAMVGRLGAAFTASQQSSGVAATAKHFPGLGAATTSEDTDQVPVTLALPLATLRSVDEAPYRAAIAAGLKLVMLSWATYPALDPRFPAGLSPAVVQGELRGRLGFRGVTISDGLAAGSLQAFGTVGRRGVLAAHAGVDLLLCAAVDVADNTPSEGIDVLRGLAGALAHGTLSRASAQRAAARVIALRSGR
jgi:beta-N-acetylhexosaminidase